MERANIVMITVALEGAFLLVAWGVGSALGLSLLRQVEWTWRSVALGVVSSAPLLAALAVIYPSSWPPFHELSRLIDEVVLPLFGKCRVFDLAVISLLAGLGEEALFRGVIQVQLTDKLGVVWAIVVTAAVFGLCHAISLTYALYAAVVGAAFGVLLVLSENLLVPVLAHASYDFVALTYLIHFRGSGEALGP